MKTIIALVLALASVAFANNQRVSQSVDANILPAMNVNVADLQAAPWEKADQRMVTSGPTAHLSSNVPFIMRPETRVVGPKNVDVTVGAFGGQVKAAATSSQGVEVKSVIGQVIDFGVPSAATDSTLHVEVVYTVLPAGV